MFADLQNALSTVKQYAELSDSSHDTLLTAYLEASKAKLNDVDEYRPFIVAAYFLEFNRLNSGIIESSGTDTIKFESSDLKIQGLFKNQRLLDKALTNIPKNWSFESTLKTLSAFVV